MEPQIIAAHVIMGGIVLTAVVDLLRVLKKSEGDTRGDDGAEGRLVVSYLTLRAGRRRPRLLAPHNAAGLGQPDPSALGGPGLH